VRKNLLASRGANLEISDVDTFLGDCIDGKPDELLRPPDELQRTVLSQVAELLPDFAMNHHTSAVRALLAASVPVDTRGEAGGTALHWACWKGYPDLVRILLDHGASLTIEDEQFHATPPGWLSHGSTNCTDGDGDHPQVARMLLAAGATFKNGAIPTGNDAVDAVFHEHGLIT
jgi:ankyrin repeat protein